jgi:hypothetical protein
MNIYYILSTIKPQTFQAKMSEIQANNPINKALLAGRQQ